MSGTGKYGIPSIVGGSDQEVLPGQNVKNIIKLLIHYHKSKLKPTPAHGFPP